MEKEYFVDTSVLLRFLLHDHEPHYKLAKALLSKAERGEVKLWTTDVVILEIVWVLKSFFKYENKGIRQAINEIFSLTNLKVLNKKLLIPALEDFVNKNIDFADAYNFQLATKQNVGILSFDDDFKKLGVKIDIKKIIK